MSDHRERENKMKYKLFISLNLPLPSSISLDISASPSTTLSLPFPLCFCGPGLSILTAGTSSIPNPPLIGTRSFVRNPLVLPTKGPRSISFPFHIRPLVAYVWCSSRMRCIKCSWPSTKAAICVRAQSSARAPHVQDVNVEERACNIFAIWLRRWVNSWGLDDVIG